MDEIQYAKGHKYLTLVYQIDLGVVWIRVRRTPEVPPEAAYDESCNGSGKTRSTPSGEATALNPALTHGSRLSEPM